jgi:predicted hydrolase (HD superfamily)
MTIAALRGRLLLAQRRHRKLETAVRRARAALVTAERASNRDWQRLCLARVALMKAQGVVET